MRLSARIDALCGRVHLPAVLFAKPAGFLGVIRKERV